MSTHRIDVVQIDRIENHPNADRLEIAYAYGWPIIVGKHQYQVNDHVIYCPVDSVLPSDLEATLFPPDSKIKLNRSRVRAIKIRGVVSQGLLIDPADVSDMIPPEDLEVGMDVAAMLGITKYEPPEDHIPANMNINNGQKKKRKPDLIAFKKYTDIEHLKYYTAAFKATHQHIVEYQDEGGCPRREEVTVPGESVIITTKIHGTSFRAGWFKSEANTFWQKIKKFFGLLPEWTFAWGSRNVQIQVKPGKKHDGCQIESQGVDFGDIYTKMVEQYDLRNRIPKGTVIYAEIVGDGVQKGYAYGCEAGQHRMYLYDIMVDGKYLNYLPMGGSAGSSFLEAAMMMGLPMVPIVYAGPYSLEEVEKQASINPISKEVNEGVVVRPAIESSGMMGRAVLKYINPEYYLNKDGTDFH